MIGAAAPVEGEHAAMSGEAPWLSDVPALEALEAGEGTPAEIAWFETLLFVEDLWASAGDVAEPDVKATQARLRRLVGTIPAYLDESGGRLPLDDLQRASLFLVESLRSIVERPNVRLAREHRQVPWERVEELDARSLSWMSRLPGRTLREKSATTTKALAVVRTQSLDLAENRVVLRFAHALRPLLDRRLGRAPESAMTATEKPRLEALRALDHLLAVELPAAPLGTLRASLRPEPNNALLGSGRYGRVWRAWRWLAVRHEHFAERWRRGARLCERALALLVAERLARRPDAFLVDDFLTIELQHDLGPVEPASIDVVLAGERLLCVSIHGPTATEPLQITSTDLASGDVISSLAVESRWAPRRLLENRGCPIDLWWLDLTRDLLDGAAGWFDATGAASLTEAIVSAIGASLPARAPRVLIAGAARDGDPGRGARSIGVDLGTAAPLLALDGGRIAPAVVAAVTDHRPDGEHVERVLGDDAVAHQPSAAAEASFFLSAAWDAIASGDAPASELASALAVVLPASPHVDCQLCVPVADALGDPGESALRAALPSQARHTWLVPRAAAAALALRADHPAAVGPCEPLLILDCGPLGFEVRMATLQPVGEAGGADPFLWEFPLPFAPCEEAAGGAARTFWLDLAREALGSDVADEYIRLVVDSGLIARVAADPEHRPGAALFGGRGQLGPLVRTTPATIASASQRLGERCRAWLQALAATGALAEVRSHVGGGRLHVLVVGEPLGIAEVAATLRAEVEAALPAAVLHVPPTGTLIARGALTFLARQQAHLPTYELALPDLYLKVSDANGKERSHPIFHEQKVRPGQVVTVPPMAFELRAGVDRIKLPLEREPGGRRPLAYCAVLDGPGLPLRAPLRIHLHVVYRYAEDGFRIRIQPRHLDETSVAFAEREVRWLRADTTTEERQLNNEPPAFPKPGGEPTVSTDTVVAAMRAFRATCDELLSDDTKRKQGAGTAELTRLMKDAARQIGELMKGDPLRPLPPPLRNALVESWIVPLCLLSDVKPDPYPKKPVPRWAPRASQIRKQWPNLAGAAVEALGRLRAHAPPDIPRAIRDGAQRGQAIEEKQWMTLGRTLVALPHEQHGEALRRMVEVVCERAAISSDDFGPFWALGTALWSEESLVYTLDGAAVGRLVARIERTVESKPSIGLFHEVGIVVLALLRRRGREDAGPVDAGTPALTRLADRIEEVERSFVARGQRREARIKPGGQNPARPDVSAFVDTLVAALRGERIALIRMLED